MSDPSAHPAALDSETLLAECEVRRTRRSGPGGQHRNKTETAVVLTHRPTALQAEASERRSQAENQSVAVWRLRLRLAREVRIPFPPDSTASELWKSRCVNGRIAINPEHQDFPTLLAEVLDALDSFDYELPDASAHLGCTGSQLVKFLKLDPPALAQVNEVRRERHLHLLK